MAEQQKRGGRVKNFFKNVWSELKKVHWPTKKELAKYTGIVLLTCAAMALVISAYDWVISTLLRLLLNLA